MINKLRLFFTIFIALNFLILFGCSKPDNIISNLPKATRRGSTSDLLVKSPLNNLNKEDFLMQFDKLSDNSKFEVNKNLFDYYNSKKWSKKQLIELSDLSFQYISGDNKNLSLKGLRYFQGLYGLEIDGFHILNIDELLYLSNSFKKIILNNCTFDTDLNSVFKILRKTNLNGIDIFDKNLTNLDFLKGIDNLNEVTLRISGKITDISALAEFKEQRYLYLDLSDNMISDISIFKEFKFAPKYLNLSHNLIRDITPLSVFNNQKLNIDLSFNRIEDISVFNDYKTPATFINLNYNKIQDVSPLKSILNGDTEFIIDDNCISDYSSVKEYMENQYREKFFYKNFDFKKIFKIDDLAGFKLFVKGKEIKESKDNPFLYFNTLTPERGISNKLYYRPACNVNIFMKQMGGNAYYDQDLDILECKLNGKSYKFSNFSFEVECPDGKKNIKNTLRILQGNKPYLAIKDLCDIFQLKYKVKTDRYIMEQDIDNGDLFEKPLTSKFIIF